MTANELITAFDKLPTIQVQGQLLVKVSDVLKVVAQLVRKLDP